MIRRMFWFGAGVGAGVGGSYWLSRALGRTVDRYRPSRLGTELARATERLGSDLVRAVREGRAEMAEAEAELRRELESVGR